MSEARVFPNFSYTLRQLRYFTIVVETTNAYLTSNGRRLPITPGMLCDVEIVTGKKSVLSYLLKPVLKVSGSALTER